MVLSVFAEPEEFSPNMRSSQRLTPRVVNESPISRRAAGKVARGFGFAYGLIERFEFVSSVAFPAVSRPKILARSP
jgi:hypothetical protein